MKICLDAGHGGKDPGAIGTAPFRLEEKEINLAITKLLEESLEPLGHWVALTRRRDVFISLEARSLFANQLGADLFISIHTNSFYSPDISGIEVFYCPGSGKGKTLAEKILESLMNSFPNHNNRGIKSRDLKVLRETKMPAVLVEVEFLSNPEQLQFLAAEKNREALANAISKGIDKYIASG